MYTAESLFKINSANYKYKLGTGKGLKQMLPGMFASRKTFCVDGALCTKEQGRNALGVTELCVRKTKEDDNENENLLPHATYPCNFSLAIWVFLRV